MLSEPAILVADEPTQESTSAHAEIIASCAKSPVESVVISSSDTKELEGFATGDVMSRGQSVAMLRVTR
jgi:hypothetical protein